MKNAKFKIGDRVWCTEKNKYPITDYHVPCTVVVISTKVALQVMTDDGLQFIVDARLFELIPDKLNR